MALSAFAEPPHTPRDADRPRLPWPPAGRHPPESRAAPALLKQSGEAAAGLFRTFGISAASHSEQIGDLCKGNRRWLLARSPCVDGPANDFRRRQILAPRDARDLL